MKLLLPLFFFCLLQNSQHLMAKSYFTHIKVDFEDGDFGHCDAVKVRVYNFLRYAKENLEVRDELDCRKNGDDPNLPATGIVFDLLVESGPSAESIAALKKFLAETQDKNFFGEIFHMDPVKSIIQGGDLVAKHSYLPDSEVHFLFKEPVLIYATSSADLLSKIDNLFNNLVATQKESYLNFIVKKMNSHRVDIWERIFANPIVDQLFFHTDIGELIIETQNETTHEVETFKLQQGYYTKGKVFNTRWEFGDEGSSPRVGQVCLNIETRGHHGPFFAVAADKESSVVLLNHQRACFDLSKSYYLTSLVNADRVENCEYLPSLKHEGLVLSYNKENNGPFYTKCLVSK